MKLSRLAVCSFIAAFLILTASYFLYETVLEKVIHYAARRYFKEHFNANFAADISTNEGKVFFDNIVIKSNDSQDGFYFTAKQAKISPQADFFQRRLDLEVKVEGLFLSMVKKQKWIADGLIKKSRSFRWFEMGTDFEAVDGEILSLADADRHPLSLCFDVKGSVRDDTAFELKCWSSKSEKALNNGPCTHLTTKFKKNHVELLDVCFESLPLKDCATIAFMAGFELIDYLQVSKGVLVGKWHYDAAASPNKLAYGKGAIKVQAFKARLPALPVNIAIDELEIAAEEETGGVQISAKKGAKVFRDIEVPFKDDLESAFLARKHAAIRPFSLHLSSDGSIRSDLHADFLASRQVDFTTPPNVPLDTPLNASLDTSHQAALQIRGLFDHEKSQLNYSCKTAFYANSQLAGELLLKGVGADERSKNRQLDIIFKADAGKLASWFSKKIHGAIANRLKNYQVSIEGHLTPSGKNWKGYGECCLVNPSSGGFEKIDFTSNLVRVFPSDHSDYFTIEGEFQGQKLTLDHFITPLLFPDEEISLKGMADIVGTFNDHGIVVRYRPDNVEIDNESFLISFHDENVLKGNYPGIHTYEFKGDKQYGQLKIKDASYKEKNTKLEFSNINTAIEFGDKCFECKDLEAFCEGIYFTSLVHFDYSSPLKKTFDISLEIPTMFGTVAQYQQLLCKLDIPTPLRKADLRGTISHETSPSKLKFAFKPHDFDFEGRVRGKLQEGICQALEGKATLQDLSFIFDYQHPQKSLQLEAIQGCLTVPGVGMEKEWALTEGAVHLKGIGKTKGDFQFMFAEDGHEMACLAGEFKPANSKSDEGLIEFLLDLEKTHFNQEKFDEFELVVDSWEEVDSLKWHSKMDLGDLIGYLQAANKSGLAPLPNLFSDAFDTASSPKVNGKLEFAINYDRSSALFGLHAKTLKNTDVAFNGSVFQKIMFDAKKRHETWMIEQFVLDDFSMAADLQRDGEFWRVNFLGARLADLALIGLEGEFLQDAGFKGKINLLEIDFGKASSVLSGKSKAFVKPLIDHLVVGELKGQGDLQISFQSDDSSKSAPLTFDALLTLNSRNLSFGDLVFQDIHNMSFHLNSQGLEKSSLSIRNLQTALLNRDKTAVNVALHVEKGEMDTFSDRLSLQNCQFSCPVDHLFETLDAVQTYFPEVCTEEGRSFVRSLKTEGALSGSFDCKIGKGPAEIEVNMQPGTYFLAGASYQFDKIKLQLNKRKWFGLAKLRVQSLPCYAVLEENELNQDVWKGRVVLTEKDPEEKASIDSQEALFIELSKPHKQEMCVESVVGNLSGLSLNLLKVEREPHFYPCLELKGSASVYFPTAGRLLAQEKVEAIEALGLTGGFDLTGSFVIPKENGGDSEVLFTGQIAGSHFTLKGIEVESGFATIVQEPKAIHLSRIVLHDRSFHFEVPECRLYCREESTPYWFFEFERGSASNIEPTLMRFTDGSDIQSKRSLYLPKVDLVSFTGAVAYPETYQGSGYFTFARHTRKSLQNTVLALPAEIISRLGLNPNALSPVSGGVFFSVANRKIYLNRFKDVYSDGKLSKFYLSNSTSPSTIDFDGNLDLYIRMKHYNLLFKLSDLFTVTVGGTLQKPTYYLNRNGKKK